MVVALGFAIVVAVGASLDRPKEVAAANAATSESQSATRSLVRTDPGINPWVERDIPPPRPKISAEPQAAPQAEAVPIPDSPPAPFADPQPASVPIPAKQPKPPKPQPEQQKATRSTGEKKYPQAEEQTHPANQVPRYRLWPGAIMSLTIASLSLENAPSWTRLRGAP